MHEDGFLPAPEPIAGGARWPWSRVLQAALFPSFKRLHDVPDAELRRVAFVALVAGGAFVFAGVLFARFLVARTGLPNNRLFMIVAGYGGYVAGVGAYRLGVSIFPELKGEGRGASLARMLFVLAVLVPMGFGILFALLSE